MKESVTWFLKGVMKDNSPWIIPIKGLEFTIGRHEDNNLILPSHSVSRHHGRIFQENRDLYISDLQSKNGIILNGLKIMGKTRLKEGDHIKIGSSEFALSTADSSDQDEGTLVKPPDRTQISFADMYGLSDREYEVLFYLIKGHTVRQMGESLFISPGTAKNHVLKIYKKTKCHSRIELATLYNDFKGRK
jgi:pSer/pThr/pTyr-binding forkhead associated (FHA) protein